MNKKHIAIKAYLTIFVCFLSLFFACDPCNDCDIIAFEPTVELVFINKDSLDALEILLNEADSISDSLAFEIEILNDTLGDLTDSLGVINDSIDNGGSLQAEKTSIENAITSYNDERTDLQNLQTFQTDTITAMNTIVSVINSGLVRVSRVDIIETGASIINEEDDSATLYRLPLSLDTSFFRYAITINDKTDTLELDYDLYQEVDTRRNVLIRAENIQIVYSSYDSLSTNCEETCNDGQASFTLYF